MTSYFNGIILTIKGLMPIQSQLRGNTPSGSQAHSSVFWDFVDDQASLDVYSWIRTPGSWVELCLDFRKTGFQEDRISGSMCLSGLETRRWHIQKRVTCFVLHFWVTTEYFEFPSCSFGLSEQTLCVSLTHTQIFPNSDPVDMLLFNVCYYVDKLEKSTEISSLYLV